MDYRDTPEELDFRLGLRAWLADQAGRWPSDHASPKERSDAMRAWHGELYAAGFLGMSWAPEHGGRGLGPKYDAILNEEVGASDCPPVPSTVAHIGRAITAYGTPEQRRQHLPSLLSGARRWCQGFSEPDAGSDIASLRTRGVLDGDHYVVNGQKMWTSEAQFADWCLLLVRTDPDAPRHRGISCLLTPMDRPGITVNPIKTADGSAHTCLVFWDDVEVDRANLLGPEGAGWNIAMTTFAYERGPADVGFMAKYFVALRQAETLARQRGRLGDDAVRRSLAMGFVRGEALRLNVLEQLDDRASGRPPGPEGSISKMLQVEASQAIWHLLFDLDPAAALTWAATDVGHGYLGSRAASVYGGSVQIQRNILSSQLLRLPRS